MTFPSVILQFISHSESSGDQAEKQRGPERETPKNEII